MESRSRHFKANAAASLANPVLQANLKTAKGKFVDKRAISIKEIDDFEGSREAAKNIRNRVLENLDLWLEKFEENATARGATVLWAKDGEEICRHVAEIGLRHGVKKAAKSKSMLSEEAGLNLALTAAGIRPIETDLGEYILQINDNEPPSHIIAPVVHKSLDEIADLFHQVHKTPRKTEIPALTREAREVLREHFLTADMGISGGNFLVAETGSVALVTNEGNGRMVTTLPHVHVVITGIEKVVPTLEDLSLLMRLLPRSATGQSISNYVSVLTGVKTPAELDGPEHLYFILVDNGRADVVGSEFQDMLRCIRCGACMNHCPVYQTIGGHAYGWVYPGPMGSVLTPLYTGLENAIDLPQAATLCNQCGVVCPVMIPLPELLRKLREKQVEKHLRPWFERIALKTWAWVAGNPPLYALGSWLGVRYLKWLAGGRDRIPVLGVAPGWTLGRDFPAPEGKTFRELYAKKKGR
ncbi:MAG: iron-sulfur cluster-binding protein [Gammaproteobacteria bacterium]|nr:iron-sulfur cluster-binding protein [Rhodocyclaceae bacterium]MBU3909416.1 iron-sulfur cluster-binding protein [Gammaproteobacteria bacterium]MBU3988576.1 iron-sulfur cluster-binding protein [Gammaproteobacteria bacterium]MBU4005354.1 iron-sulfur cluster-binding protein [Gammaproteobacteria bacterium]MBU4021952.1 iron-sulfur cluster-binding protein [Gammaproteobacteria bacterium]